MALFRRTQNRALWAAWRRPWRAEAGLTEDASFAALHTAMLAAPYLRTGLSPASARKAARHLRSLLGVAALALTDSERVLAWDGACSSRSGAAFMDARPVVETGRPQVIGTLSGCATPDCPVRAAVIVPLMVSGAVTGALGVYGATVGPGVIRAATEVARWAGGQLELAELDRSRRRLADAEVRALRAQISPHFVYNCLTTIASFVRTDPERARDLLLDFADFARYSFQGVREFTTLADELRSIDRYLALERARFGERLEFSLHVAPEVLSVALPFLSLQPLVENAIRHGMEGRSETGQIEIVARDAGADAMISIEDNGVGMDPERLRDLLGGESPEAYPLREGRSSGVGLRNVDERMRQVYGDEFGLLIETAPGAGMKVTLRVPKYRSGVLAS